MRPRTSSSHPLRIDTVLVPKGGGLIGMTLCPGRRDRLSVDGPWERDVEADFDVVTAWRPNLMLTLVEASEFTLLGVPDFAQIAAVRVPNWRQLPIADGCAPDERFETAWRTAGVEARAALSCGGRVLLHCRAGLGRTGTVAARLLVELGLPASDAMIAVRRARRGTIENRVQEEHVRSQDTLADASPSLVDGPLVDEPLSHGMLSDDGRAEEALDDRIRGSILGAAIGDALGSAFEFLPSRAIEESLGGPVVRDYHAALPGSLMYPRNSGIPTDDTAMTLALIDALVATKLPTARAMFETFGERLRRESGRFGKMFWNGGPGGACVAMLRAFDAGAAPFAGLNAEAGGNGAAMRAHPCGAFPQRGFVAEIAAEQARLSHPHPSAVAAAQVVALVVHEGIYSGRLMRNLPAEITDVGMIRAWNAAHENLVRASALPAHLRDVDMAGWNTVAAAHAIAQLYADDLETGIGIAAGSGRDTDTVASIVGAMLGAVHGRRGIPLRWLEGLVYREAIEEAAGDLSRSVAAANRERANCPASERTDGGLAQRNGATDELVVISAKPLGLDSVRNSGAASREAVVLSSAFLRAMIEAEFYHHEQRRKSTKIPYFSHLLGVCSLVLEAGGTEIEAIAALLHDAPEDAGGAPVLAAIEQHFGPAVATIVEHLSDGLPEKGARKGPWLERKTAYLKRLREADASTLLVSAADKLHNLRSIQADFAEIGDAVFERFGAPEDKRTNTLWYYRSLFEVYTNRDGLTADPRLTRLTRPLGEILALLDTRAPA